MTTDNRFRVGVDIGGTFTDVFYVDEATGACGIAKVPSVRADIAQGQPQGGQPVAVEVNLQLRVPSLGGRLHIGELVGGQIHALQIQANVPGEV